MRHAEGVLLMPPGSSALMPARCGAMTTVVVAMAGPAMGVEAGWPCRRRRCATPRGVPPSNIRVVESSTLLSSPS
eukprot:scaffold14468_cov64-Phaeocystis_antarctica.AAC.6